MSRPPRIVVPGCPLHVILRGNNRRRLFSGDADVRRMLFFIGRALEECAGKCLLHALVIMTNHLHAILYPEDAPTLSNFVKRFSQRYAQTRNQARGGSGKLFEQRYVSIPILSERQLAVTTQYIEMNPVRAGLVDHPGDYPWSTYALHAGLPSAISPSLWTPSVWYESLGCDPHSRAAEYVAFMRECTRRGELPEDVDLVARAEALSQPTRRRFQRPDGTSAL
jgi:putative transposase